MICSLSQLGRMDQRMERRQVPRVVKTGPVGGSGAPQRPQMRACKGRPWRRSNLGDSRMNEKLGKILYRFQVEFVAFDWRNL